MQLIQSHRCSCLGAVGVWTRVVLSLDGVADDGRLEAVLISNPTETEQYALEDLQYSMAS